MEVSINLCILIYGVSLLLHLLAVCNCNRSSGYIMMSKLDPSVSPNIAQYLVSRTNGLSHLRRPLKVRSLEEIYHRENTDLLYVKLTSILE